MKTTEQQNKPINGNDLIALGYPENEILGIALKINKKKEMVTQKQKCLINMCKFYLRHKIS